MAEHRETPLAVRLLWAAIVVVVLVLVVQVGRALTADTSPQVPELRADEIDVEAALLRGTDRPAAVRGYVFVREPFPPQLCQGRTRDDPPRCVGPVLSLSGLDLARLDMARGDDGGVAIAWSKEPVSLFGTFRGAEMRVREILA